MADVKREDGSSKHPHAAFLDAGHDSGGNELLAAMAGSGEVYDLLAANQVIDRSARASPTHGKLRDAEKRRPCCCLGFDLRLAHGNLVHYLRGEDFDSLVSYKRVVLIRRYWRLETDPRCFEN